MFKRPSPLVLGISALVAVAGVIAVTAMLGEEEEEEESTAKEIGADGPSPTEEGVPSTPGESKKTRVVNVKVPEGVQPGQQIVIKTQSGQQIGVQLPPHVKGGQMIQVEIPDDGDDAEGGAGAAGSADEAMQLPQEAAQLFQYARKLMSENKLIEATALVRKALELTEQAKGASHPMAGLLAGQLGILLKATDKYDEAEMFLRRAVINEVAVHGEDSIEVAAMMGHLAGVLEEQGRFAVAVDLYRKCASLREAEYGLEHEAVASSLCALAGALKNLGQIREAEAQYERAKAICEAKLGVDHESVGIIAKTLATFPKLKALAKVGLVVDGKPMVKADSPWSPVPDANAMGQLELVAADPFTAHADLANAGGLSGKACLVQRGGGCTFAEKVDRCVAGGAAAVLVVSNDEQHPESVFQMGSSEGYEGPVPAVMVGFADGMRLKAQLAAQLSIAEGEAAVPVVVEFVDLPGEEEEEKEEEKEEKAGGSPVAELD